MTRNWMRLAGLAAMLGIGSSVFSQSSTKFSYQGELGENGQLAQGDFTMRFSLWNAPAGGSQVGSTILLDPVSVVDGRFTVDLDYGAGLFNNAGRWLEITVDGITLNPRQEITRSPYSIQTRGIFVDGSENVGIGTTNPQTALHVGGQVWSTGLDGGYLVAMNPNNQNASVSVSWLDDVARLRIGGTGPGASGGLDIQRTGNASLMRILHNGDVGIGTTAPTAKLDVVGNGNFHGRLGVGDPDVLFGQLTVADSGDGAVFALSANSNNSTFPTIFANNAAPHGPVIWAQGQSDASLSDGGLIVSGDQAGLNLAIDNNEIMARNNGSASSLFLNAEGGPIRMGPYGIQPALAYGRVSAAGTLLSASGNVTSVAKLAEGLYDIRFAGGLRSTDIFVITCQTFRVGGASIHNGVLEIGVAHADGGNLVDSAFSFVVYRP